VIEACYNKKSGDLRVIDDVAENAKLVATKVGTLHD
jgi:hypothetical protein